MELIAYIGPMWSGKTVALAEIIKTAKQAGKQIGIFDHPNNTRNSKREIGSLCQETQPFNRNVILSQSYDILVFDEIHFYEVFGNTQEFLSTIRESNTQLVVLAGIYYDFYNAYRPFPIWNKLSMNCEFRQCYTVQPCFRCGTYHGVQYTVSIGDPMQRVGDFYRNVCRRCGIAFFREWQEKVNKQLVMTAS